MSQSDARPSFVHRILSGLRSLASGMAVTIRYFVRPSTVVTQQYPENRAELKMFDRFRARLMMNHDENGFHKCTACRFCEMACPNGSLKVNFRPQPQLAKNELDTLVWRLDSCTFCNACVLVCPFSVLRFDPEFESSVYDRRLLVYNMSQYAGAPAGVLMKVEDPAKRAEAIEPRSPYDGPLPLRGKVLAGVAPLVEQTQSDKKPDDAD